MALAARTGFAAQTPVGSGADFPPFVERISALLAMAPTREVRDDVPLAFYYADVARQMASAGVELPDPNVPLDALPEGYARASYALPLAAHAFGVGESPEWFETFGFNPFGVSQVITLNDPPEVVSIFSGGIDGARVATVLEANGYSEVLQETGGPYWSVGDELDLDSPVGRLGVGMMNHAAIYDDTVVFAQSESDLQEVTQTIAGNAPSMREQDIWSNMAGLFSPDLVGLIPVSAGVTNTQGEPELADAATPVRSSGIEVEWLAFGVRAGSISEPLSLVREGTPEATPVSDAARVPARVEVRIRYGNATAADHEAEAIPDRWEEMSSLLTGEPYTDLMELVDARVHEAEPQVVAVDFLSPVPNRWIQMIQTFDLVPFIPVVG